jgi:hypothetical protein
MLFLYLPTPAMAGAMAARLFTAQASISTLCSLILLGFLLSNKPVKPVDTARAATIFIAIGLVLALAVEWVVSPRIVARENPALWHRLGSAMYFAQWVCATVSFAKLSRAP